MNRRTQAVNVAACTVQNQRSGNGWTKQSGVGGWTKADGDDERGGHRDGEVEIAA